MYEYSFYILYTLFILLIYLSTTLMVEKIFKDPKYYTKEYTLKIKQKQEYYINFISVCYTTTIAYIWYPIFIAIFNP